MTTIQKQLNWTPQEPGDYTFTVEARDTNGGLTAQEVTIHVLPSATPESPTPELTPTPTIEVTPTVEVTPEPTIVPPPSSPASWLLIGIVVLVAIVGLFVAAIVTNKQ